MQQLIETIQSFLEPWLLFLADDPMLRLLQCSMLLVGALVIFLVFFTTRDILLRTNSFLYMFVCILIVAALPVVGFLFYLLIRPARTLKERELYAMVLAMKERKGAAAAASPKTKAIKNKKTQ